LFSKRLIHTAHHGPRIAKLAGNRSLPGLVDCPSLGRLWEFEKVTLNLRDQFADARQSVSKAIGVCTGLGRGDLRVDTRFGNSAMFDQSEAPSLKRGRVTLHVADRRLGIECYRGFGWRTD